MNLYFIALLSISGFYAFNYYQILNMEGWEIFDKHATENEKEKKENLADQMLEADKEAAAEIEKNIEKFISKLEIKLKKNFGTIRKIIGK